MAADQAAASAQPEVSEAFLRDRLQEAADGLRAQGEALSADSPWREWLCALAVAFGEEQPDYFTDRVLQAVGEAVDRLYDLGEKLRRRNSESKVAWDLDELATVLDEARALHLARPLMQHERDLDCAAVESKGGSSAELESAGGNELDEGQHVTGYSDQELQALERAAIQEVAEVAQRHGNLLPARSDKKRLLLRIANLKLGLDKTEDRETDAAVTSAAAQPPEPAEIIANTLREQAPRFTDHRLRDLALRAATRWDRLGGRPVRPAPSPLEVAPAPLPAPSAELEAEALLDARVAIEAAQQCVHKDSRAWGALATSLVEIEFAERAAARGES